MTPYRDDAAGALEYCPNDEEQREPLRSLTLYPILKRTVDILGSTFGLIVLSPLFAAVAVAIKWEDPKGPVFSPKPE